MPKDISEGIVTRIIFRYAGSMWQKCRNKYYVWHFSVLMSLGALLKWPQRGTKRPNASRINVSWILYYMWHNKYTICVYCFWNMLSRSMTMQSPLSVRFFVKSGPNYVMGLEHDVGDINKGTDDQYPWSMSGPKPKEDNGSLPFIIYLMFKWNRQ